MPYADPDRQAEYQRAYQASYQRRRYHGKRAALIEYLGGHCEGCGATENLEFDHRDPRTKVFAIMSRWKEPIEVLASELAKCQLLCSDCHKDKTYPVPPCGTVAAYRRGCKCEPCRAAYREARKAWG